MNLDINAILEYINTGNLDIKKEKVEKAPSPEIVLDKEHIRFNRSDLINVIKMAAPIFNPRSDSYVPKSVVINYDMVSNTYKMITNSDIEYVEYTFDVLNETNRLVDSICLPISLIKTLLKMFDEEILIYKVENTYFIKLQFDGDLELEIPKPEAGMLRRPGSDMEEMKVSDNTNKISCAYVEEALQSMIPIVKDEQSLENRRITFDSDRIIFTSSKLAIQYLVRTPKIKIGIKLAEIIRNVCAIYPDEPLELYRDTVNNERIYLKCKNILVTSTCLIDFNNKQANEYLDKNRNNKQVIVNTEDLKKITQIATGLPYSDGKIGFKYRDTNLVLYIKTLRKVESEFIVPIKTKLVEDKILEAFKSPIYISGRQLEKVLDAFNKYEDVIFSMTLNSVILNKNTVTGIIEK